MRKVLSTCRLLFSSAWDATAQQTTFSCCFHLFWAITFKMLVHCFRKWMSRSLRNRLGLEGQGRKPERNRNEGVLHAEKNKEMTNRWEERLHQCINASWETLKMDIIFWTNTNLHAAACRCTCSAEAKLQLTRAWSSNLHKDCLYVFECERQTYTHSWETLTQTRSDVFSLASPEFQTAFSAIRFHSFTLMSLFLEEYLCVCVCPDWERKSAL